MTSRVNGHMTDVMRYNYLTGITRGSNTGNDEILGRIHLGNICSVVKVTIGDGFVITLVWLLVLQC